MSAHEGTDFLYPFIDAEERDSAALLVDLAASANGKAVQSARLRVATLDRLGSELEGLARAMAERIGRGGRVFSFGNGGSSTDAASFAALLAHPPWGRPLPARSLVADESILSALGNDVGFELVFSRQLIAYAGSSDVAVGFSTSGNSENVMRAFGEARSRDMLTVGLAGYEGGQMAACQYLDHCLVVRSDSVHRIQETQAGLVASVWARLQVCLGEVPADGSAWSVASVAS
ncbi:MAG: D-sedoheptulose-7-phosphate isomerase [Acidimicrobiales bacterium]